MKLLIIEDEIDLLTALKKGFIKMGYAVDTAEDGEEGAFLASVNEYDVIILDLNLPSKDGLDVLREIRTRSLTQRVIILSARSSVSDKVLGLDIGANDYLAKPFDFFELAARVRSLARRSFVQDDIILQIGKVRLDTASRSVEYAGKKIDFAPKEYAILEYLALHRGQVISAETLIEHVWESDIDMFSASVKVHISNIRKKLSQATGNELIQTRRGSGYIIEKED